MAGILTAALTSGGTVLDAGIGATVGYLGARRGARAGLEAGRADRLWANRTTLYEGLVTWVRERCESVGRRCQAALDGEIVEAEEPGHAQFPAVDQLST
jgi:hypothetical protein